MYPLKTAVDDNNDEANIFYLHRDILKRTFHFQFMQALLQLEALR